MGEVWLGSPTFLGLWKRSSVSKKIPTSALRAKAALRLGSLFWVLVSVKLPSNSSLPYLFDDFTKIVHFIIPCLLKNVFSGSMGHLCPHPPPLAMGFHQLQRCPPWENGVQQSVWGRGLRETGWALEWDRGTFRHRGQELLPCTASSQRPARLPRKVLEGGPSGSPGPASSVIAAESMFL